MAKVYIYDRRNIDNTNETQFFHEARAKRPNKEIDTNMPLDARTGEDLVIKKIVIELPTLVVQSNTPADVTFGEEYRKLMEQGVLVIQVGEGSIYYYPLSFAIGRSGVDVDVEYSQGTAADATYGVMKAHSTNGTYGLETDISWGANDTLKFYIRTADNVTVPNIKAVLECERKK